MLTKIQIYDFLNKINHDRTLRIDKTLLAEICDQALKGIDLQLNMVPNNGRMVSASMGASRCASEDGRPGIQRERW